MSTPSYPASLIPHQQPVDRLTVGVPLPSAGACRPVHADANEITNQWKLLTLLSHINDSNLEFLLACFKLSLFYIKRGILKVRDGYPALFFFFFFSLEYLVWVLAAAGGCASPQPFL